MIKDIYLVDDRISPIKKGEIEAVEARYNINLPMFYKELLLNYGPGLFSGLIELPSPSEICLYSGDYRWPNEKDILDEESVFKSYKIANTIDADTIVLCPDSKKIIYVLPRHDDTIYWIDENFEYPTSWYKNSGITSRNEHIDYYEPLTDTSCYEIYSESKFNLNEIIMGLGTKLKITSYTYSNYELIFAKEISGIIEIGHECDSIRIEFNPSFEEKVADIIFSLEADGRLGKNKLFTHL